VLLITSEDNGPQLGCYGDRNVKTPNLDRLAAEGARFETAWITQAVCSPSRSSILTGLYPHQNGQIGLATHKYAMFRACANIPSLLRKAGYRTGIMGKLHVNPASAFPFGFRWNPSKFCSFRHRDVRKIAEVAGKFMAASLEPFFLMVNYPDAHLPFLRQQKGIPERPHAPADVTPPSFIGADTPRLRKHLAAYYDCISRLDTGVGLLLARLAAAGHADDTLVIYLGDHGSQFSRGKGTCYEPALRVPFIVRWPVRGKAGQVRRELVSSVDILPTILDAAGAEIPKELPGRSLLPLVEDKTVQWREHLFAEWTSAHPRWYFPQRVVRDGRHKLIVSLLRDRPSPVEHTYTTHEVWWKTGTSEAELAAASESIRKAVATWRRPPPEELYDLQADPDELHNLAGKPEHAATQKQLRAALADWQRRTRDPLADPALLDKLTDEHDAAMKAVKHNPKARFARDVKGFRWRYLDYLRRQPRP